MTDWNARHDAPLRPLPEGMSFDEVKARARQEGILEDLLYAGATASDLGVTRALDGSVLPLWAQEVVRSQFA